MTAAATSAFPPLPVGYQARIIAAGDARAIGPCENPANRGQIPDSATQSTGGDLGEYWCADETFKVVFTCLRKRCPLLRSGSCEQVRQHAKKHGALRTRAEFDAARAKDPLAVAAWIGLSIGPDEHGNPHAHHSFRVGVFNDNADIVTLGPRGGFLIIEGNAADPKATASRNGNGCYAGRERGHPGDAGAYEFIDLAAYR